MALFTKNKNKAESAARKTKSASAASRSRASGGQGGKTGGKQSKNLISLFTKPEWIFSRKYKSDGFIRIEEINRAMERGIELNDETVVSMYIPRRRRKLLAAALLRLDRLYQILLALVIALAVIFLFAFIQEKAGNFTINLNRVQLYRHGIALADDGEFTKPTARLVADPVKDITNISITDLPGNLDSVDGSHNGQNYMAYTFYIRNAGKEDIDYQATIRLTSSAKNAEDAARLAVWRNGERIVYAEPAANGRAEPNTVKFLNHETVCSNTVEDFLVGYVDKYTVVAWLEGDDPECVDAIVNGSVQFGMDIETVSNDDDTIFRMWVQDIKDTLEGTGAINAAGTEAPTYYLENQATWSTRRNQ